MARLTPQEFSEKHARRLTAATQDIAAGVERVTESPGRAAAAKADKWAAGVQKAISSGKWQKRVGSVTLDQWKSKMQEVGISRIASGVEANKDKTERFAAEFLPHLDAGVAKVKRMSDNTLEGRIQRAVAMMQHNATFERKS